MIKINLLPEEVTVSEFKINPQIVVAGVGGFLILVLLPVSWAQHSHRKRLQDEIVSLQSELDRY